MNNSKVFIIAELSANHNNDIELAKRTIKAASDAGADAVKVQTYTADSMALDVDNEYFGPKKEGTWKGIRPYDLYKEASLPYEWHSILQKEAEDLGILFFSTPFDLEGVDFLEQLNVPMYKIASFEITDIPLIKYVAEKQKPIIVSTGIADLSDIELVLDTCRAAGNEDVTILKCTSQYPATIEDANLLTIPDMMKRFGVKVGVSDHTFGSIVPVVAVSLGARVVEKHLILDRNLGGHDSSFSMEPDEFKKMVLDVRNAEKALGGVKYDVTEKDKLKRKSLFISEDIMAGEEFTSKNVRSIRPGHGLPPKEWDNVIGQKAGKDYKKGTPLKF